MAAPKPAKKIVIRKTGNAKRATPARSNAGGAVRGQQRAAQVQAGKPISLPSPPKLPTITGVPQIDLFHAVGNALKKATGQKSRSRGRQR